MTLRYLLFACCFLLLGLHSVDAQQTEAPFVEVELTDTTVVPGQPTVLRVTVLVPTWLPKPVAFPTFEAPNLMVKLFERATQPVSRTIDGDTWSGVTRAYRLSPMVPGRIDIPANTVEVTWAEPGSPDPIVSTVTLAPITLTGSVPEGAEDLDPFLAATALSLSETLSSEERVLKPGDSLTRTVTLDIAGTSPLFAPVLMPPHQITGMSSYPAEPKVTETSDRDWLSGTREESTTLVAESGGSGAVPAIELRWYNLDTGAVETARVDGFDLSVDGPVARTRPEIDWPRVILIVFVLAVAGYALYRFVKWAAPKIKDWLEARRAAREATEDWAYERLRETLRRRDFDAMLVAYDVWRPRLPALDPANERALEAALTELGASLYSPETSDPRKAWGHLSKTLDATRTAARAAEAKRESARQGLVALNPS